MSSQPVLEKLRERLRCLEDTHRRFSRTIPVSDAVDRWLPQGGLPAGCIHEVKGASLASALAFSSIISARIAGDQGNVIYVSPDRSLFSLGLLPYGIKLEQLLLVSARRPQDRSWAMLEALRCPQVSAVITVLEGADLTASRRLQLAAESSGATGFLLGKATSAPIAAPITRWKVSSQTGRPGQRFDQPIWKLDLLYCRGGQPGSWTIEWRNRELNQLLPQLPAQQLQEALAG